MALKSTRNSIRAAQNRSAASSPDLLLQGHDFLDPFAVGLWTPQVDICETESRILVRVELPGVELSDIALSFQGGSLRLQGIKREPVQSRKLLCYYCLERRYGSFDRHIGIDWIVNPRMSRAYLDKGILTIELPMIKDRRGERVEIQIKKK
jgi:HSP20 family protein